MKLSNLLVIPYSNKTTEADQAYLLHQNARQIQTVISAASGTKTFDGALTAESCASPSSDYEELACAWQGPSKIVMSARVGDDMNSQWALPVVTVIPNLPT